MNESNPWEKQLQSWTPRRPSARLRQQLFPAATGIPHEPLPLTPVWVPLAAATCVFMLMGMFLLPRQAKSTTMAGSSSSNFLASLAFPDHSCQQWNLWSAVTFEWTKASPSLSITGSFGLGKTNL